MTPPTTLSGWLVGVGSVVGAVAMFLPWIEGSGYTERWGLAFGVNVLVLIVLLGIAATIFLARMLPSIPRQSLAIQIVVLVGVGIGLDRALTSFSAIGAIIFLIAMLAAAAGALLPELEMDRAVGGPQA